MSTFSPAPRRRRVLVYVAAAVAFVAASVAGALALNAWGGQDTSTPQPSASAPIVIDDGDAPDGCLGGETINTGMLRDAQAEAPHTLAGAVEFATAFSRWGIRWPAPTAADGEDAQSFALAANSDYDLEATYKAAPNFLSNIVPAGSEYHLSSLLGEYEIVTYSEDEALVNVSLAVVVDGELRPELRSFVGHRLVWGDHGWEIEASVEPLSDVNDMAKWGTPYSVGC